MKFCNEVGDSRNYYTHFDPRNEKKALKGKELFDAIENIKILLPGASKYILADLKSSE